MIPLRESVSNSKKVKDLIIRNIEAGEKNMIRLNLVYLNFDFSSKTVLLEYYVEDDDYPSLEVSFADLVKFLKTQSCVRGSRR